MILTILTILFPVFLTIIHCQNCVPPTNCAATLPVCQADEYLATRDSNGARRLNCEDFHFLISQLS